MKFQIILIKCLCLIYESNNVINSISFLFTTDVKPSKQTYILLTSKHVYLVQ